MEVSDIASMANTNSVNVKVWLGLTVSGPSTGRGVYPRKRTSGRECLESCCFRPVYIQVRKCRKPQVDVEFWPYPDISGSIRNVS